MFCPKCGTKALDGAEFCQKCGTKLIFNDAERESSGMADHQAQPDKAPGGAPKKKKPKKLPIILIAIVLILAVILIASNFNDLENRGEQALRDEEYINSHQADVPSEAPSSLDTTDRILIDGIPIENVMQMTADEVIAAFGKPKIYIENDSIEYGVDAPEWMYFDISNGNTVFSFSANSEEFTLNRQILNLYL